MSELEKKSVEPESKSEISNKLIKWFIYFSFIFAIFIGVLVALIFIMLFNLTKLVILGIIGAMLMGYIHLFV